MEGETIMSGNNKNGKNLLFKQMVIMEVNPHVYARIAERKSRLVNLDTEIREMEI